MIEDEPAFGTGHNSAGMLTRDDAVEDLRIALERFAPRKDEFLRAAAAAVVRDRGTAGSAADVIKLARDIGGQVEAVRLERSRPYRDTGDALKACADAFWRPVAEAMEDLEEKVRAWDSAEDDRIAAQRQEQQALLSNLGGAAPIARPARTAKARPVRGDYGGKVTRVQEYHFEVLDPKAVPDFILNSEPVKAAIIAAVKPLRKLGTEIPGIRITPNTTTRAG